jgi:hypothetical protein
MKKEMSVVFDSDIIEQIEQDRFTYLHCTYIASEKYISDWYVNINENSYLVGGKSLIKLKLLNVIGIPLAPQKYCLKKQGDILQFSLIFPAIPKEWEVFDFIEDTPAVFIDKTLQCSTGFYYRNIKRNDTDVYKITIV